MSGELSLIQAATQGSGVGVWVLVGIAIITLIRGWPALRKLTMESDQSLRKDLLDEVRLLRQDVVNERNACEEKLAAQNKTIDGLEGQIKGLERQLLQLQMSSGRPMALDTPATDAAMETIQKHLDDK